ncbi:hypothetical protein NEDG_02012 [Nematocida displodere]|uniref:Uncharacterized protein n=1 Tax=Nematocida displodere TaxID=1805483 RepID=A0A177EGD2_9MICR|nr:hypothetical protein NEDG_02012 [Nematocida displodere]
MGQRSRTRDVPALESGDAVITNALTVDASTLRRILAQRTLIIVDRPGEGYIQRLQREIDQAFGLEAATAAPDVTILSYQDYQTETETLTETTPDQWLIFMNIRKTEDKKRLLSEMRRSKQSFIFLSNIYKIEKVADLEKLKLRILPVREDSGLARSTLSFGRNHEIIFAGEQHLKAPGFSIAVDQDLTVPCIIATESEEQKAEALAALERTKLAKKGTADLSEYLGKKKWALVLTYDEIVAQIRGAAFAEVQALTASVLSYDCTDKTAQLLAMHQIALNVFSLSTTQTKGRVTKIIDTLPAYGINLLTNAQHLATHLATTRKTRTQHPKAQHPKAQ